MQWDFKTFGELARTLAAIVAVFSVVVAGAWYAFQFEGRLRTVEAQILALGTRPQEADANANALSDACNEIYSRAADFRARRLKSAEAAMIELLKKIDCPVGGNGGGN